jgi:hypothetical protein
MLANVVALRAVALALKGLLALWVLHLGLALIGIVVLIVWGVALIITAHPVHPVRILGVVNDAAEIYEGHTYVRTELSLGGDGRLFMMDGPAMQPPMSLSHPASGDIVALWVDPDLSWVDMSKTEIYAISLGQEGLAQPAHTNSDPNDPAAKADRQRLVGAGVLGLVAVIFGLGYAWDQFSRWISRKRPPPTLPGRRRRIEDWPRSTPMSSDWSVHRRADIRIVSPRRKTILLIVA